MKFRFRKQQLAKAYKNVFSTSEGQLVLHDIIRRSGVLRSSFDTNPHVTSFKEGERNVALHILYYLGLSGDDIRELAQTNKNYLVGENDDDRN